MYDFTIIFFSVLILHNLNLKFDSVEIFIFEHIFVLYLKNFVNNIKYLLK